MFAFCTITSESGILNSQLFTFRSCTALLLHLHIPLLDVFRVPLGLGLDEARTHAVAIGMLAGVLLLLPERSIGAHAVMAAIVVLVAVVVIGTVSVLLVLLVTSPVVLAAVPTIVPALVASHVLLLVILLALIVSEQRSVSAMAVLQVVFHFVGTVAVGLDPEHQEDDEDDCDQRTRHDSNDHGRSLLGFGVDSTMFVLRRHSRWVVVVWTRVGIDLRRRPEHWRWICFRLWQRWLRNVISRLVVVIGMVLRMVDRVVVLVADCAGFSRSGLLYGVNYRCFCLRRNVGRCEFGCRRGRRA